MPAIATPDAHIMPARMSSNVPPHAPSTRTGRMFASGAMPAMPMPLFVLAAIWPATNRPWKKLIRGSPHSPVTSRLRRADSGRARCRRARVGIGDEVVAGQDAAGEVRMRQDAGIDDRDRDAVRARLQRPRGFDVDPRDACRAATIAPSTADRSARRRARAPHRIGVLHLGVRSG